MRPRRLARNSHGNFQKTSNQVAKSQEARHPARSFPEMSGLFRSCARNRTRSKPARLSALRLSFYAVGQGTDDLKSVDTLRFQGMATYKDRLKKYQGSTGLLDAVISGYGILDGYKVAIAVMDFGFLAATMGSVVGERVTRTIEYGTAEGCAVIIVAASGGARLYEGMLSLMQMAKTSGALARHAKQQLPYISVLTNPTTAGVMASFASLGDVIIAEPKSMIGFAGPRVIRETTHQDLPERFQTAEFLQEHGLIDMIVHRKKMREQLSQLLSYFAVAA